VAVSWSRVDTVNLGADVGAIDVTPQVLLGVFTQDYTIEPIITCVLV
jgi:hypothetical protein